MPRTTRRRVPAPEIENPCGVMEQPLGYTCNRKKGHRGPHRCVAGDRKVIVEWDAKREWHGPVVHGVATPDARNTLCGARAGTPETPITYEARYVRCLACLAVITARDNVVPARRRGGRHAR